MSKQQQTTTIKPGKIEEKIDDTQVRQKDCKCKTSPAPIFVLTGAPRNKKGIRFRYVITLKSSSRCDRGTPGQCEYNYQVAVKLQQQSLLKGKNRNWTEFKTRAGFIKSFTIHDSINQSIKPSSATRKKLNIGFFKPNSPIKGIAEITVVIAPSINGGKETTVKEKVELCLPMGGLPTCPIKKKKN